MSETEIFEELHRKPELNRLLQRIIELDLTQEDIARIRNILERGKIC